MQLYSNILAYFLSPNATVFSENARVLLLRFLPSDMENMSVREEKKLGALMEIVRQIQISVGERGGNTSVES
jgi:hypothetical protein